MRALILRKLAQKRNGVCTTTPRPRKRRCYENSILVVLLRVAKVAGSHALSRFAFSQNYSWVIVSDATSKK